MMFARKQEVDKTMKFSFPLKIYICTKETTEKRVEMISSHFKTHSFCYNKEETLMLLLPLTLTNPSLSLFFTFTKLPNWTSNPNFIYNISF